MVPHSAPDIIPDPVEDRCWGTRSCEKCKRLFPGCSRSGLQPIREQHGNDALHASLLRVPNGLIGGIRDYVRDRMRNHAGPRAVSAAGSGKRRGAGTGATTKARIQDRGGTNQNVVTKSGVRSGLLDNSLLPGKSFTSSSSFTLWECTVGAGLKPKMNISTLGSPPDPGRSRPKTHDLLREMTPDPRGEGRREQNKNTSLNTAGVSRGRSAVSAAPDRFFTRSCCAASWQ